MLLFTHGVVDASNLGAKALWEDKKPCQQLRTQIPSCIGAKQADITKQFLAETLLLTGTGGILGVAFGLLCGPVFRVVRHVIQTIDPELLPPVVSTLEPRIALWSVVFSLVISVGAGLGFGIYPARKAAQMDPIEALRHE